MMGLRSIVCWVAAVTCGCQLLAGADNPAESPKIGRLAAGKVLFLGNSITLHGPAPAIGWTGNWGMAATAIEKDYVHLVQADIARSTGVKPEIKVRNIADFERGHHRFDIEQELKPELDFKPDLVIVAIGENVPELTTDEAEQAYADAFSRLLIALKAHGDPVIFVRSSFWANPVKDDIMRKASHEAEATFIDISKLGSDESNAARSERKIEHAGVAGHPGDKGMKAIADAIFAAIKQRAMPLK